MRSHRRSRGAGAPPFVDPDFARELSHGRRDRESSSSKANYKDQQLCRQAERALGLALADLADDVLRELVVESVQPFPDATRLVVKVVMPQGSTVAMPELLERLERAQGRLRYAVAQAITRKRAPELVFVPLSSGEVMP